MKLAWFVVLLLSMAAAEKTEQCLRTITCKDSWFMEYSCTCNSVYCECKAEYVVSLVLLASIHVPDVALEL